jgi:hypothetical protein
MSRDCRAIASAVHDQDNGIGKRDRGRYKISLLGAGLAGGGLVHLGTTDVGAGGLDQGWVQTRAKRTFYGFCCSAASCQRAA